MTEIDLSVFIAKTNRGYVGYVRIHKGRVLWYTAPCDTADKAEKQATEIKEILSEHSTWWKL